jgi:signal transduction histidine kinase
MWQTVAPRALSLDQRRSLLLACREALNNIVKHSRASEVLVAATWQSGTLELRIEDNGRGFDPADIHPGAMGLAGLRHRLEGLGGRFQLESAAGRGTKILLHLPLPTRNQ